MPAHVVTIGPLRTSHGLADVRFDGGALRLTCFRTAVERLDRYRLPLLALALAPALVSVGRPRRVVVPLLTASGLLLVLLLGLLGSALATGGREWLVHGRPGRRVVVPEPDIALMDPVHGAWRARLVLHTADGELVLSGWWWRRAQLDRLQRALAA